MKRIFLALVIFLLVGAALSGNAQAQTLLRYPIPELGYCRDAKECYLYCEIPQNKAACWSYGSYKLGPQVLAATTISSDEEAAMRAKAKELGITFPIAELGNCAGPQECRDFCEQPTNHTACMNFAQKHGFDKGGQGGGGGQANEQEILTAAQTELGCTTKESCFRVCEQNHDRCETFMKRHGLSRASERRAETGGPDKGKLMEDAKTELGCTSMESCAKVCEQNHEKCMEFARRHGFDRGGTSSGQQTGPGGCNSETTCRQYCQEHPSECPGYQGSARPSSSSGVYQQSGGQSTGNYVGPSGCRTQEECAAYCKANPSQCPGFSEVQKFQQQYQTPPSGTSGTYTSPDPAQICAKTPGCSWTGSNCNCTGTQTAPSSQYQPPPNYPTGTYQYPVTTP